MRIDPLIAGPAVSVLIASVIGIGAMTGLLPATARWLGQTSANQPAEITFGLSSWLAPARVSLRGYRHNGWQIEPRGPMLTYATGIEQRLDPREITHRGVNQFPVEPPVAGAERAVAREQRLHAGRQVHVGAQMRTQRAEQAEESLLLPARDVHGCDSKCARGGPARAGLRSGVAPGSRI